MDLPNPTTPPDLPAEAQQMAEDLYRERLAMLRDPSMTSVHHARLDSELDGRARAEVYAAMAEPLVWSARGVVPRARFRPTMGSPDALGAHLMATVLSYAFYKDIDGLDVALRQASPVERRMVAVELSRYRNIVEQHGPIRWA